MSVVSEIANDLVDLFGVADSVNALYEKIDEYYSNPSPESMGEIFGFVGTQALGQISGKFLDKFIPTNGQEFLWKASKGQFDDPRGYEDERSKSEAKKKVIGFFIGLALDNLLSIANENIRNSEVMNEFFDNVFPAYDWAYDVFYDFLNWWDPYGINDYVIDDIQAKFHTAESTTSPLILDLDSDGVETISKTASIHFDHDGNGFAETTGWVGKDDGLLVWDRNGNGLIDDGSELFGNNTKLTNGQNAANGFAALAELDSNQDGKIDANDAAFNQLRIWKDADSDAALDAGELLSLGAANVGSLNTAYTNQNLTDAQGNKVLQAGTYTDANGVVRTMNDIWFAVDTARTENLNVIEVSAEIAALPEVAGFGNVASLRQAMACDASDQLKTLVSQFATETDATKRQVLLDQIIFKGCHSGQTTVSDYLAI